MPSLTIKGHFVSYEDSARDAVVNYLYTKEAEADFKEASMGHPATIYYCNVKYKLSSNGGSMYTFKKSL